MNGDITLVTPCLRDLRKDSYTFVWVTAYFFLFRALYLPDPSPLTRFYHPKSLWRETGKQIMGPHHEIFQILSTHSKYTFHSRVSKHSASFPQAARLNTFHSHTKG
jgi:hypothetical protein